MKHPIVLAIFSAASPWNTWVSYGAGIWYTDFSGAYPGMDSVLSSGAPTKLFNTDVGGVLYDGEALVAAGSVPELLAAPSFFWDGFNRTLYARFPEFNPPNDTVFVGINFRVGSELYDDQLGHIYLPHLKDLPPIAQEKDRLFFKKLSTASWTMSLDNSAFTYDGMPSWGVYNQRVQYYIGEAGATFEQFDTLRAGRIKDFAFDENQVVVNVQDLRAQLTSKLPARTLTIAEYADLNPNDSGKVKPMGFGRLYGVKPICVNPQSASGPYTFLLADSYYGAIKSIDAVRVAGALVTPNSISLSTGSFTLTAAQVKDGSSFLEVLVDFKGYVDGSSVLIENPLDIMRLCIQYGVGLEYNSSNFDTLEWERKLSDMPPVAIYLKEQIQVLTVIERVMESTRGGFMVTSDGRYTWRMPNYTTRPKWYITNWDWINNPRVNYDTSEVLAYSRVGYRKAQEADTYRYDEQRDYETEVRLNFNIVDNDTFETLLVDESDAVSLNDSVMALSFGPAIMISGKVSLDFVDIQIGENLQVDVNHISRDSIVLWLGTIRGEVLSVAPDVLNGLMEISMRVIEGIPEYTTRTGAGAIYGLAVYGQSSYGEG